MWPFSTVSRRLSGKRKHISGKAELAAANRRASDDESFAVWAECSGPDRPFVAGTYWQSQNMLGDAVEPIPNADRFVEGSADKIRTIGNDQTRT